MEEEVLRSAEPPPLKVRCRDGTVWGEILGCPERCPPYHELQKWWADFSFKEEYLKRDSDEQL